MLTGSSVELRNPEENAKIFSGKEDPICSIPMRQKIQQFMGVPANAEARIRRFPDKGLLKWNHLS